MSETLLEYMKKTGCFIVIAQLFIQMCASRQMEKHVKTQVGLMILLVIGIPVISFFQQEPEKMIWNRLQEFEENLADGVNVMEKNGSFAEWKPDEQQTEIYAESQLKAIFEEIGKDYNIKISKVKIDTFTDINEGQPVISVFVKTKKKWIKNSLLTSNSEIENYAAYRTKLCKELGISEVYLEVLDD